MPSSCPIPKGNALPAQMCGQGVVLFLEEIGLEVTYFFLQQDFVES